MYKHSLDLIFYLIGDPSENELMLHSALVAFTDALHMLLRNQVEKRGVLENLDLVLLCLDETIDDGCVSSVLRVVCGVDMGVFSFQNHRRDRLCRDRLARESAKGGHDRDRDQRADDHERVPDHEGEDAATYWPTIAANSILIFLYCIVDSFRCFHC